MSLQSLPLEIFELVVVSLAVLDPSELLASVNALQLTCKTIYKRVAISCMLTRQAPFVDEGFYNPVSFTNPPLWANIYKSLFSSSAVQRRNFPPSSCGYTSQLLVYCSVLQRLRHAKRTGYDTLFADGDLVVEDDSLEIIMLMLLECDGKNTCHLEWAGAYEYCMAWLKHHLFPLDENGERVEWPRDDRYVACALANTWHLTTVDKIRQESREESTMFRDMLFRLCTCAWKYPQAYAPLHRFNLPIQELRLSPDGEPIPHRPHHVSIGTSAQYPTYRAYDSPIPRLNTDPTFIDYYGTVLSWSPPLLANNAKKLFFSRTQMTGLVPIPDFFPLDRQELLRRRQIKVQASLDGNRALLALFNLVSTHGVGTVYHMIQTDLLPPHIPAMEGFAEALNELADVTGIHSADSVVAVGITLRDIHEWNSNLEVQFPLRGGWNEDGDDPNNRRWSKDISGTALVTPPQLPDFNSMQLPYRVQHLSEIHDTTFWRLKLCGDPFVHEQFLGDMLSAYDRRILERASLGGPLARLHPGRTWRPGLLDGLFQGRFTRVDEQGYMTGFHSASFPTPQLGSDISWTMGCVPLHFYGRFQEHHLIHHPKTFGRYSGSPPTSDPEPKRLPLTCDARTFPRHTAPLDQEAQPIEVFATSIAPEEDLLIDEGGHNAFMPSGARHSHSTNLDGSSTATFGWGTAGVPSPDHVAHYETFSRNHPSKHDSECCPTCTEQQDYLDGIERMRLDWEEQERNNNHHVEEQDSYVSRLFASVGLDSHPSTSTSTSSTSSTSPLDPSNPTTGQHDEDELLDSDIQHLDDDSFASVRSHSPKKFQPCDGILDIVMTGETDIRHGQGWNHFHFFGRVRLWDGLVCILRIPKNIHAGLMTTLFYGYFESDLNFVGSWRMVIGDRMHGEWAMPPIYSERGGLNGAGLMGSGGAGVLGDGIRVVQEGPFVMSRVMEDEDED